MSGTVWIVLLQHGADDPHMDLLYFWAAVLLALTPVLIFGGLGVWVLRKIWQERRAARALGVGGRGGTHPPRRGLH
jgi:hypothetical protein